MKKVCVVGAPTIGKTALVKRCARGYFDGAGAPTVGVEVRPVPVAPDVYVSAWDCAGADKWGGLCDGYYLGADAALGCFRSDADLAALEARLADVRRATRAAVPVVLVRLPAAGAGAASTPDAAADLALAAASGRFGKVVAAVDADPAADGGADALRAALAAHVARE